MSEAIEKKVAIDKTATVENATIKYTKESIIKSEKYKNRADILSVLLDDEKSYDLETVDKTIEKFMKGKVN